MNQPLALEIVDLKKQFGSQVAVNHLHLQIPMGQFYALLGPNGAGKTTTLRIVAGLLEPDRGDAWLNGHSICQQPKAAKQVLAYLPEDPMLYSKLNPMEYLEFVAGLWGIPPNQAFADAKRLLDILNLWDVRDSFCETFSRGMKQKLALAGAFIHRPQIIILDEPLTGLDAAAAKLVKDILKDYVAQGNTVILTTHIMEIAERLAERIGIINQGELVAEGTLDQLKRKSGTDGTLEAVFLSLTRSPTDAIKAAHD
ncbi:MAG: ABC transporter ATP-binding protein [Elainellaceae cyanobacterium]